MLEYATRGRRSIYPTVWQTSRIFRIPLFEITCAVNARPCALRLKVVPNFLRPRARTLPVILSPPPVIQRAYVQIQIERDWNRCAIIRRRLYLDFATPISRSLSRVPSRENRVLVLFPLSLGSSQSFSACVYICVFFSFFQKADFITFLDDIKNTIS